MSTMTSLWSWTGRTHCREVWCAILWGFRKKKSCTREKGESRFKRLVHREQKNCARMKYIIQKFTNSGKLVVDTCFGSFSVHKSSMLLPKLWGFIGFRAHSSYVTGAIPQLIRCYALLLLCKTSDIDGEEDVRSCAEMYVEAVKVIDFRKRLDM